jgi:hypothetical protein
MTDIGQIGDDRWVILASFIHDGLNTQLGFKPDGPNYTYKELLDAEFFDGWCVIKRLGVSIDKPLDQIVNDIIKMYVQFEQKVKDSLK